MLVDRPDPSATLANELATLDGAFNPQQEQVLAQLILLYNSLQPYRTELLLEVSGGLSRSFFPNLANTTPPRTRG